MNACIERRNRLQIEYTITYIEIWHTSSFEEMTRNIRQYANICDTISKRSDHQSLRAPFQRQYHKEMSSVSLNTDWTAPSNLLFTLIHRDSWRVPASGEFRSGLDSFGRLYANIKTISHRARSCLTCTYLWFFGQ